MLFCPTFRAKASGPISVDLYRSSLLSPGFLSALSRLHPKKTHGCLTDKEVGQDNAQSPFLFAFGRNHHRYESFCFFPLRGPAAILVISRDTGSDSIAKLLRACFYGLSHIHRAIHCKSACAKLNTKGGYRTILGGANLPEKVSHNMGYRSDSIAISRDMGPLSFSRGIIWTRRGTKRAPPAGTGLKIQCLNSWSRLPLLGVVLPHLPFEISEARFGQLQWLSPRFSWTIHRFVQSL